jgi:prephenate dehydratase
MIGYLGEVFTQSFYAASTFYIQEDLVGFSRLHALFQALEDDEVEGIVLPFERTNEANIYDVLELILKHRFHINRDILYTVRLQLYSINSDLSAIKKVIADEASHIACEEILVKTLGKYQKIYVENPVIAMNELSEYGEDTAALSINETAKRDYHVLMSSDVLEESYNLARYIYVTKSLEVLGFHNKMSILCQMKESKPGSLYTLLHELALKQINLTNILFVNNQETRHKNAFYIEFYGHFEDEDIKEALEMIKYKTDSIKIVGSYFSKVS